LWGQGFRPGGLAAGELGLGVGELLQGVVPFGFQAPGDQPVFRVDSPVPAFGSASLVAGLFDLASPLGQRGIVAVLKVLSGGQGGVQRSGDQGG